MDAYLKLIGGAVVAATAIIGMATAANAHTTSLGYVPGATAGSVIIWAGHYNHSGFPPPLEGIGTLTGVSLVYGQSSAFSIGPVNTKPTGLIDGTNNFFWSAFPYIFPQNVDPMLFGGVVHWQGVQFTGLAAGTYDYTCGTTCGFTQEWASLNTVGGTDATVRFTLTGGDINPGVPEPATWALMVIGFGMVGAGSRRRRGVAVAA